MVFLRLRSFVFVVITSCFLTVSMHGAATAQDYVTWIQSMLASTMKNPFRFVPEAGENDSFFLPDETIQQKVNAFGPIDTPTSTLGVELFKQSLDKPIIPHKQEKSWTACVWNKCTNLWKSKEPAPTASMPAEQKSAVSLPVVKTTTQGTQTAAQAIPLIEQPSYVPDIADYYEQQLQQQSDMQEQYRQGIEYYYDRQTWKEKSWLGKMKRKITNVFTPGISAQKLDMPTEQKAAVLSPVAETTTQGTQTAAQAIPVKEEPTYVPDIADYYEQQLQQKSDMQEQYRQGIEYYYDRQTWQEKSLQGEMRSKATNGLTLATSAQKLDMPTEQKAVASSPVAKTTTHGTQTATQTLSVKEQPAYAPDIADYYETQYLQRPELEQKHAEKNSASLSEQLLSWPVIGVTSVVAAFGLYKTYFWYQEYQQHQKMLKILPKIYMSIDNQQLLQVIGRIVQDAQLDNMDSREILYGRKVELTAQHLDNLSDSICRMTKTERCKACVVLLKHFKLAAPEKIRIMAALKKALSK